MSSRIRLAGLSAFLHKSEFNLFLLVRVLRVVLVGVGYRVLQVLGREGVKAATPV